MRIKIYVTNLLYNNLDPCSQATKQQVYQSLTHWEEAGSQGEGSGDRERILSLVETHDRC